jgi:hypothetical protein
VNEQSSEGTNTESKIRDAPIQLTGRAIKKLFSHIMDKDAQSPYLVNLHEIPKLGED